MIWFNMENNSRRNFLRGTGMAIGSIIHPMSVSATQSKQQMDQAIRIRGSILDPLDPSELAEKRREIVDKASDTRTTDYYPTPRRSPVELDDNEYIVAYNLDLIDGAPSEWVGIAEMTNERSKEGASGQGPYNQRPREWSKSTADSHQISEISGKVPPGDLVTDIHSRAKQNAQMRKYRKQENKTDAFSSNSVNANEWGNWDTSIENEWYKKDEDSNKTGWTVQWKTDPSEPQKHGVHAELRMYPHHSGLWAWDNKEAKINFEFGDDVGVESHEPGNTIGSNTESWSLGYSSGGEVSIGIGGATTSSNLDIDDTTVIDGNENHVTHTYTFSGDLKGNSLFLPASATAVSEWNSGETFVDFDLVSKYFNYWRGTNKIANSYEYYW